MYQFIGHRGASLNKSIINKNNFTISNMYTKLINAVLKCDVDTVRSFIEDPSFDKKKSADIIRLCLRIAIQRHHIAVVKLFDEKFDLNFGNDTLTVSIAAESDFEVWKVIATKDKPLKQTFLEDSHPLVVSFRAGNYDVAKWLKEWCDHNKVDTSVKIRALKEAAEQGHVDVCKLYTVSDKYMAVVIKALIFKGHSDKVVEFVKGPLNDFSFNDFEMLKLCSAHFDAMCAIIRHPSVNNKMDNLPVYYRAVNDACKTEWEVRKKLVLAEFAKMVAERVRIIQGEGIPGEIAIKAARDEYSGVMKRRLEEEGLDSFVYRLTNDNISKN